jgi:hypothetical protein
MSDESWWSIGRREVLCHRRSHLAYHYHSHYSHQFGDKGAESSRSPATAAPLSWCLVLSDPSTRAHTAVGEAGQFVRRSALTLGRRCWSFLLVSPAAPWSWSQTRRAVSLASRSMPRERVRCQSPQSSRHFCRPVWLRLHVAFFGRGPIIFGLFLGLGDGFLKQTLVHPTTRWTPAVRVIVARLAVHETNGEVL